MDQPPFEPDTVAWIRASFLKAFGAAYLSIPRNLLLITRRAMIDHRKDFYVVDEGNPLTTSA